MNCIEVVLYFLDLHSEIMRKGKTNIEEHNTVLQGITYKIYQRRLQKTLLEYSFDHVALASFLSIDLTDKVKPFFLLFPITEHSAISGTHLPKRNS